MGLSIPEQRQDLLQHFGFADQMASFIYQLFEQSLRVALVGIKRADKVHGNIRTDQNHGRALDAGLSLRRDFSVAVAHLDLGQRLSQ
jgi:hypothetical protein